MILINRQDVDDNSFSYWKDIISKYVYIKVKNIRNKKHIF